MDQLLALPAAVYHCEVDVCRRGSRCRCRIACSAPEHNS